MEGRFNDVHVGPDISRTVKYMLFFDLLHSEETSKSTGTRLFIRQGNVVNVRMSQFLFRQRRHFFISVVRWLTVCFIVTA